MFGCLFYIYCVSDALLVLESGGALPIPEAGTLIHENMQQRQTAKSIQCTAITLVSIACASSGAKAAWPSRSS